MNRSRYRSTTPRCEKGERERERNKEKEKHEVYCELSLQIKHSKRNFMCK